MQDKPVTLAAIAGAHGVTGEVRVKLFGEGVESLRGFRAFSVSPSGEMLTLKKIRDDGKGGAIARFEQVTDRNAAEKLRGSTLTVPRSALPALGDGEYYHADLIGLPAISTGGAVLGTVVAVENFGASDVIEIEKPAEAGKKPQRFMVPMNEDAVPAWDAQRLVVADGWHD